MHFTKVKGILSSKNGMNLFRGCTHGCIYCDSRSNCYRMNHKFDDVEVKENGISLLEENLKRKRKKCMIGLGSMTDPYIEEELGLNYTRQTLEIDNDAWKEAFSMQIEKEHSVKGLFADDYKIIGFPFFNNDNRMEEFEKAINTWMETV